jgi:hypothetical protein
VTLKRARSGRRYSAPAADIDFGPSSPVDPRVHLPISERVVVQTTLPDGTILQSYEDAPLVSLLDTLPDVEEAPGLRWPADKPRPPKGEGKDRWERLR